MAPAPVIDPVGIILTVVDTFRAQLLELPAPALAVGAAVLTLRVGFWVFKDVIDKEREGWRIDSMRARGDREWDAGCYNQARSTWRAADRLDRKWAKKWGD